MNGYQRVKTALELKKPDRVPIVEFLIDSKVIKRVCPEAKDQADFAQIVGLDAVTCLGISQFNKISENSDGTYVDEWGVLYKEGGSEAISHPIKGPIQTMCDLEHYVPPDPDAPHRLGNLPELVKRFKGRKAIIFQRQTLLNRQISPHSLKRRYSLKSGARNTTRQDRTVLLTTDHLLRRLFFR